ncbi:MAG TPA: malate synthase G, partial [Pseudorhizobium sp.]|nr:malate synthase G [Pseudorhizobium sp.]
MAPINRNGLAIDQKLHDFLVQEAIPGTGVDVDRFFSQFAQIVHDLAPKNRALLEKRDEMQAKLDDWYRRNGAPADL